MIKLDELSIRMAAGNEAYKKGIGMHKNGNVDIVAKDYEDNTAFISAEVESSSGYDSYSVDLEIDNQKGLMSCECECPAYRNDYSPYYICKHIVAVIFKYMDEINKISKYGNRSFEPKGMDIINQIKSNFIEEKVKKESLNIQYIFDLHSEYQNTSSLEMKIGTNKMYVVKSIRELLENIYRNGQMQFGKNFTYNPDIHVFNDNDKKIINILLESYETNEMVGTYSYDSRRIFSGKKVYLGDRQLKRILNLMGDKTIDVSMGIECRNDVSIVTEDMPLNFSLKSNESEILLSHEDIVPLPITKDGEYFLFGDKIYKPSKEQVKLYIPIYNSFVNARNDVVTFDKSLMNQVASYVIPNLKKVGKSIRVAKELEKDFYQEPLKLKFYFDRYGEGILSKMEFIYGAMTVNPFKEEAVNCENGILIRDIEGEMQVNTIYKNFGFDMKNDKFVLEDEEKMVKFLAEGLEHLQDMGEVYYSDSFKKMKVYTPSNFKSSVRLNNNDLLEFSFSIEGIDKRELKDIFKAIKEKKRYHRLKDGGFIPLNNRELNDVAELVYHLDIKDSDFEKDKILLSKYNAIYLDQNIKQNNMFYVERNKKYRELVNNVRDIQEADFEVPNGLKGVLRNYQRTGFKWFKTLSACGFGGILADEMGLGKTLQTIAFVESDIIEQGDNKKPALVVAPTSLVYNWKSEVERFSPSIKALVISGNKKEREVLISEIQEADMVITSYPLIRRDIEEYKDVEFSYCFLDEAQQIKNPVSQNAQVVKEIKATGRFALTGTPMENSLTELWSIFDFIMPGYLMSHGKFVKRYETPIAKYKEKNALDELNKHIKPFILRRFKSEVVKELPPKIEHKIVVEMTEEQKKLYAAYLSSAKEEMSEEIRNNGFNKSKIKILALLTRLRQICCDPSSFIEDYDGESGKMLALDELLEESIGSGHRILLFSQFTSVLKNIEKRLKKNGIEYMYLDGKTPSENRMAMVNKFNEGFSDIFLISLKAGGTGLNLTGADVVIHFDPWWNPAVEQQAVDRAHRIGQRKTVEVIKFLAQGTIEEKIYDLQEKKKEIIKSVIDDDNSTDVVLSSMSQQDLEGLFK